MPLGPHLRAKLLVCVLPVNFKAGSPEPRVPAIQSPAPPPVVLKACAVRIVPLQLIVVGFDRFLDVPGLHVAEPLLS